MRLINNLIFIMILSFVVYGVKNDIHSTRNEQRAVENYILKEVNDIDPNDPPCFQLFYYLNYYSDSLNIPKQYMFGIARMETGYRGPLHYKYNHTLQSGSGAVGPMQVMPSTANLIHKKKISKEKLKSDIKLNVQTSALLIKKLYNKYKNWKIVFGCYNTGRPIVNSYAEKVFNFSYK